VNEEWVAGSWKALAGLAGAVAAAIVAALGWMIRRHVRAVDMLAAEIDELRRDKVDREELVSVMRQIDEHQREASEGRKALYHKIDDYMKEQAKLNVRFAEGLGRAGGS
jgi:hypothetical protein